MTRCGGVVAHQKLRRPLARVSPTRSHCCGSIPVLARTAAARPWIYNPRQIRRPTRFCLRRLISLDLWSDQLSRGVQVGNIAEQMAKSAAQEYAHIGMVNVQV